MFRIGLTLAILFPAPAHGGTNPPRRRSEPSRFLTLTASTNSFPRTRSSKCSKKTNSHGPKVPIWLKDEKAFLFSDIPPNKIWRWKEGEGLKEFLHPSGYTGKEPFTGKEPGRRHTQRLPPVIRPWDFRDVRNARRRGAADGILKAIVREA